MSVLPSAIAFLLSAGIGDAREKILHYTVNDGLSQHSVTSIVQDSDGMLWVGTFDGLNMFDGRKFYAFRHSSADSTSLLNNRILALASDEEEGLWVLMANNSLAKLTGHGRFKNYHLHGNEEDLGNEIRTMTVCDGYLLISNPAGGIEFFKMGHSPDSDRISFLKQFVHEKEDEHEKTLSIAWLNDNMLISTSGGIYRLDRHYDCRKISDLRRYHLKCSNNGAVVLWRDNTMKICKQINGDNGIVGLYVITEYELPSVIQAMACHDNSDDIWIGTLTGLFKIHNMQLMPYLSDMPIRAIYCDDMGVVWCGGRTGLQSVNPYVLPVGNYKFVPRDFALGNQISAVFGSGDNLWTGSIRGLYRFSFTLDQDGTRRLNMEDRFLEGHTVSMIEEFSRDTIIVGSNYGLKFIVRKGNGYAESPAVQSSGSGKLPALNLYRGARLKGGSVISAGNALLKVEAGNNGIIITPLDVINSSLETKAMIMSMAVNPVDSLLWVCHRGNGISIVSLSDGKVLDFHQYTGLDLPNNYVWDVFFGSDDEVWIGTDAGLNRLFRSDDGHYALSTLSVKDGLVNDKIETIEEDGSGYIWAGTSQGIIKYDKRSGKVMTFNVEDGFQSNNFTSASCRLDDGTLFFGGINGISYFNPLEFESVDILPRLVVRDIYCKDRQIEYRKKDRIVLKAKENVLKITVGAYYSPNPSKIRYEYSINEGDWIQTSSDNIFLSNLKSGRYIINLRCSAGQDTFSEAEKITINVKRPVLLSTLAILLYITAAGAIIYVIILNSAKRKIAENKLKMKEQLREAEKKSNAEKLNFYTNLAHEIKTPLSLILGRIYDIETCGEASPYIMKKTQLMGKNVKIIKDLTDQILEFKRVLSGNLKLELQEQDIIPHIKDVVENYSDYASKHDISITLESSSEEIVKYVDLPKIIRIVYNLVSNAIKFSEHGGNISIKVLDKKDSLVIVVADVGCGISAEDLPHVFERFYKSDKSGGSGIGLAFTKSLVELMGGHIDLHSKEGVGSTFIVTIPEQKKESVQLPGMTDVKEKLLAEIKRIPAVLIVEDNVELNEYINEILLSRFTTFCAYDGNEAMKILKSEKIDLILSDIMMPGMDGMELVRKIKGTKKYEHIPVVFLSAKTTPEDKIAGLETGAIDYIEKPFNPNIILIKVQNILAQYYLSKEAFRENTMPSDTEPVVSRDEMFINKARKIIYDNMADEEFGVNALSREMGMSRVHLAREFQRIIQQSPSSFIRSIRFNYARQLLMSGKKTIKEVIFEIGIKSQSGFTKIFKEEFGYLPSQMEKIRTSKHDYEN